MGFQRIKALPKNLAVKAIETAVERFILDCRIKHTDPIGMFNQTIESIAQATIFATNDAHQYWMASKNGEVMSYALVHVSKDVDNQLTFTVSQAWVHPQYRGTNLAKSWWQQLRSEAKRCLCRHIIIPSSRNVKVYKRFLKRMGSNYQEYVTLIKEDI